MAGKDKKPDLPVHLVNGANEYAKIKAETAPRNWSTGRTYRKKTKFVWTVMSPGKEVNVNDLFLTHYEITKVVSSGRAWLRRFLDWGSDGCL